MANPDIKVLRVDEVVNTELDYAEQSKELHKYLCKNNAWYYGRPASNFNMHEALEETEKNEKTILIIDNLS